MALIRMCVVPNSSQHLSWPILWIITVCATYWTHSTAVCVLMVHGLLAQCFDDADTCPLLVDSYNYVAMYIFYLIVS